MNIVIPFVSAEGTWVDWGCGVVAVGVGAGVVVGIGAGVAVGVGPGVAVGVGVWRRGG